MELKASIRWFVTGTPIQNKKADFYSLCQALGMPASFYRSDQQLEFIREQFVLKRTKAEVGIALEAVQETDMVVPWASKEEKQLSEEIHSSVRVCGISEKRGGLFSNSPLIAILRAKQSCIMPSLMQRNVQQLVDRGELDTSYLCNMQRTGSKLQVVVQSILRRRLNGKGKIVFCHFREEIDYLATKLKENCLSVAIFDGRSHGKRKMRQLGEKYDVLILQIQTGCEGLNLQEFYSEVYFVSPHWNPAARCHRIGQTKPVYVERFEKRER
jgi:SNF2 family DNA or RNA helicase